MHGVHLSAVDANLVLPLHALLETRSVSAAAKRVGLSPSATSHALARLRAVLGDPLLVRAGQKLVRTPRGETLLDASRQAVERLQAVFAHDAPFDPRSMRRAFRVATTDHVQLLLLRTVDERLTKEAPGVDFFCLPMDWGSMAALREGTVDFSIGVFGEKPPDIRMSPLFVDELVAVARRGHPVHRGPMTTDRFVAYPHALVAPLGTPSGLVDEILERMGKTRRVARTVPTFVEAALLVAETDYLLTIPRVVVSAFQKRFGLRQVAVPLALPRFTISVASHRRHEADAGHGWMRDLIVQATRPPTRQKNGPKKREDVTRRPEGW
jgi:DNA-binding transcriptional LysR family regulator